MGQAFTLTSKNISNNFLFNGNHNFKDTNLEIQIKKLGYKGLAYEFCLYNNKIKIASSSVNPNRWIVKYNCSFDEVRKYEQLLKNLSFEKPENMSGKLLVVELSPITGVKSIHGGTYSQCGVRLNCIHLELTNESWIYIQNDHPIITNKINPEKVRCFYGKNNNKKSNLRRS